MILDALSHKIIMAALWNTAGYYIFVLWYSLFIFFFLLFPRLFSAVAYWMSTILPHGAVLVRI